MKYWLNICKRHAQLEIKTISCLGSSRITNDLWQNTAKKIDKGEIIHDKKPLTSLPKSSKLVGQTLRLPSTNNVKQTSWRIEKTKYCSPSHDWIRIDGSHNVLDDPDPEIYSVFGGTWPCHSGSRISTFQHIGTFNLKTSFVKWDTSLGFLLWLSHQTFWLWLLGFCHWVSWKQKQKLKWNHDFLNIDRWTDSFEQALLTANLGHCFLVFQKRCDFACNSAASTNFDAWAHVACVFLTAKWMGLGCQSCCDFRCFTSLQTEKSRECFWFLWSLDNDSQSLIDRMIDLLLTCHGFAAHDRISNWRNFWGPKIMQNMGKHSTISHNGKQSCQKFWKAMNRNFGCWMCRKMGTLVKQGNFQCQFMVELSDLPASLQSDTTSFRMMRRVNEMPITTTRAQTLILWNC